MQSVPEQNIHSNKVSVFLKFWIAEWKKGCFDSIWLPQSPLTVCIVNYSRVVLPALDSKQIKNFIWLSRTLVNVMEEYFANKIIQLCGKQHETEVTKLGKCAELNLN